MKLVDLNVTDFINEVDSKSPAPGGGSVSALSGSIGASLLRMVGHLTTGKKKFKALDKEDQEVFLNAFDQLILVKENLTFLIDEDTNAFNLIMAAFKLPKVTEEEIKTRKEAIVEATRRAIEIPLNVANECIVGLTYLEDIKKHGNKNCLSDIGVAAMMLKTGAIGALMNVKINIPGLSDVEEKTDFMNQVNEKYEQVELLSNTFIKDVFEAL